MKFKNIILVIVFSLFVIQPTKVESSDIVSDILGTALEQGKKSKLEREKWGVQKKDLVGLKSKEIKPLISGNIIFSEWNDNEIIGKTEEVFYEDGSFEAVLSGKFIESGKKALMKEKGTWYVKQGKLCFNTIQTINNQEYESAGCVKVLKLKTNPNVYFLRARGLMHQKFVKIISIKGKIEEERIAKEKKEEEKRLAKLKAEEEKKQQEEEEKRIAEEEKRIAEEEKKIAEEEKKLAGEIEKPKNEKLAELASYKKSHSQLFEKADQISSLLFLLKDDNEGGKLIVEYNNQVEEAATAIKNIPSLDTKQIEAFKIDTKMHLALEEYVKKHEGNISSYEEQIQAAQKARQEKLKAQQEKQKAEQEKKKKDFLKSYAGTIDGYQDVKFGMDIHQVVDTLTGKCILTEETRKDGGGYLAGGWEGGSYSQAIKLLMGYYSLYVGEKCYQILSNYPDMHFGFDKDYRLNSVITQRLMKVELINSRQRDQLTEIVKKIEEKYTRWYPPGTTSDDWNSWVNEFNARNADYILYAFEEGQVMLSIGYGGFKYSTPTTFVPQMLYFSKNNDEAKDFYIQQLKKFAGTSSGEGL